MILPIILSFSSFSNANIREISEIAKGFLFLTHQEEFLVTQIAQMTQILSWSEAGGEMYPIYL